MSAKEYTDWFKLEIMAEGHERQRSLKKFREEFDKSKRTAERYYAKAKRALGDIDKVVSGKNDETAKTLTTKVLEEVVTEEKAKAIQAGLRLKYENSKLLQDRADDILEKITTGKTVDSFVTNETTKEYNEKGRIAKMVTRPVVKTFTRDLKPFEIVNLNRVYVSIMAEIARREGEHAPVKVAETDTSGKDVKPTAPVQLNIIMQPRPDKRPPVEDVEANVITNVGTNAITVKGKVVS